MQTPEPRIILASVTDKRNLDQFKELTDLGWEMLSTGGTATRLRESEIPVTTVEEFTGMAKMMGGRLKTLHPKNFGGILARRNSESDMRELKENGMVPIDIVAVNLYDFLGNPCVEEIDIGGPSMLRAAAKNFEFVTVLIDPNDYAQVIKEIITTGSTTLATRRHLAQKVFRYTHEYDQAIEQWFKLTDKDNVSDSA